jgi:hypothetical protein
VVGLRSARISAAMGCVASWPAFGSWLMMRYAPAHTVLYSWVCGALWLVCLLHVGMCMRRLWTVSSFR